MEGTMEVTREELREMGQKTRETHKRGAAKEVEDEEQEEEKDDLKIQPGEENEGARGQEGQNKEEFGGIQEEEPPSTTTVLGRQLQFYQLHQQNQQQWLSQKNYHQHDLHHKQQWGNYLQTLPLLQQEGNLQKQRDQL